MTAYSEYKESTYPWIGTIPCHWDVKPIRSFLSEVKEYNTDDNAILLTLSQYKGVNIRKGAEDSAISASESLLGYNVVHTGQFVMNIMLAWNGSYGVSDYDGVISPAYSVFNFTKDVCKRYFHYLWRTKAYQDAFKTRSKGIVDSRLRLYPQYFLPFYTSIPPKEEQKAIVSYLDKVTDDIDKAIEAKERIIAALEERRKIIISQAVTRGINHDVPLRDSGIDWLGKIPAHWETIPVRHAFEFRNGYTPSKVNPAFWTNGTIPWFRMEDIRKSGRKLDKAIQYITPAALNNGGTFEAGSFILAICTASIGEHAMLIADSQANQQFANLKIRKSLAARFDSQFIFYYMYVLGKYCKDSANTTTFQYADMTLVKNFIVPIPTLDEQQKIVEYLDFNTEGIDEAIKQQKHLIELLIERKNIIINETVTGHRVPESAVRACSGTAERSHDCTK